MTLDYIFIPLIALLAFFLKGITGTGASTVIVALSSFFISPKLAVILASFINIFAGLSMLKVDSVQLATRYWVAISLTMIVGSVLGAWLLSKISNEAFNLALGVAFLFASIWFLFKPSGKKHDTLQAPTKASSLDLSVGAFAGFCGGFIGVNAPF